MKEFERKLEKEARQKDGSLSPKKPTFAKKTVGQKALTNQITFPGTHLPYQTYHGGIEAVYGEVPSSAFSFLRTPYGIQG